MSVLLALTLPLLLGLGWLSWRDAMVRQARLRSRLALLVPAANAGPAQPGPLRRIGDWLADSPLVGSREVGLLRQNLYAAGFTRPDAVDWYIGFKMVLAGLLLGVAALWVQIGQPSATSALLVLLGSAVAGLKGPDAVLDQRAAARRAAIDRGLPDALDLLVVCGEAGIGLELALERVASELKRVHPELATELGVTVSEMRLLADRLQGLTNMGNRVRLDSVRTIASTLSQTMRYGTPLGRALRTMTADFRLARQMKMEETAARLPVIITLPMIMFILPSTALIVAGPAFLQLIDALRRLA
ncbi:type II secretion system F family protein [Sandarakinorhabdus sp. AAP62]|uniref:type II secretion system F family protein n=1 Tax=Sandarakinorhabdus sp. AAP62 TaxID=1248916 RepID=UPI00030D5790|nr:type II secretion system F family protein [Sandarakinorhabdus sp. AAP62]